MNLQILSRLKSSSTLSDSSLCELNFPSFVSLLTRSPAQAMAKELDASMQTVKGMAKLQTGGGGYSKLKMPHKVAVQDMFMLSTSLLSARARGRLLSPTMLFLRRDCGVIVTKIKIPRCSMPPDLLAII